MQKYTGGTEKLLHGRDLDKLFNHDWPGNVRELENTIQRYVNLNILEFPNEVGCSEKDNPPCAKDVSATTALSLREAMKQFERGLVFEHLQTCRWNRTRGARRLGIQRKTLYPKMQQLGSRMGAVSNILLIMRYLWGFTVNTL